MRSRCAGDRAGRKKKVTDNTSARRLAPSAAPQGALLSRKHRNLYRETETPELAFELTNPTDRAVSVPVRFTTVDYFGKAILRAEKKFELPAKRKVTEILRYPECRLPGFYCTTATWKADAFSGSAQGSFVKVGPVPAKKDPLFGFNNDCEPERAELMAAGAVLIHFRWIWWFNAKPEKFAEFQKHFEELRARGIEPIGDLQMYYGSWQPNTWKKWFPKGKVPAGQAEPTMQQLEEVLTPFVGKLVARYKPWIRTWFLGGEVESGAQKYASALPTYIEMIKFISATIRRGDPGATVFGIGIGGFKSHPFFVFMPKILPHVKHCIDGINPDIYPAGQTYGKGYLTLNTEEAGFRAGMLKLSEMAKVTKKQGLACAEGGPNIVRSTPLDDPCGLDMANTQARQYILLKTVPNMRYWMYFRMDNWNPKSVKDWGMWEKENPRQVVSAYAATARIMGFAEFVKELPLHQDIPCWIFKKDGKYFAAFWYNGKDPLKVRLASGIPAEALDVQGNPIELKDGNLHLGAAPVYLYADSPETLAKLLAHAADNVSELSFLLERLFAGKTLLMIRNQSGHAIDLKLESAELPGGKTIPYQDRFTLAPGEIKTVEKPVGADHVTFRLETGKGRKYTASATLKAVPVPRVSGFAELAKKAVPQKLDDPIRQVGGYDDLKVHGLYTGLDDLSGVFRLGYDDRFLYLEAVVKDDIHRNDCAPGQLYNGDSIQFAVDANRDAGMKLMRGVRGYANDDFNFVSGLVKGTPRTRCFVASQAVAERLRNREYPAAPEIIRDEAAKTTTYRIKLAFDDLAPLKPVPGKVFGFSLLVFDKDEPNSFYHMAFSPGVGQPFDPSQYPAFRFE